MKELTIQAAIENTDIVIGFVNKYLAEMGGSPRLLAQIDVAVDDIFANIASYAYPKGAGDATVRVETAQDPPGVIVTFIDQGIPYDPTSAAEPDVTLPPGKRPIGGLGIFMVRKTMDAISYVFRDGRNVLTLRKNL